MPPRKAAPIPGKAASITAIFAILYHVAHPRNNPIGRIKSSSHRQISSFMIIFEPFMIISRKEPVRCRVGSPASTVIAFASACLH
jgi:hypothetical protein